MGQTQKLSVPRAEARAKRRQQLIDATMKCIARKGIGGTTLGDVAREAGLSQGIVNLHFESKDNLLRETLEALAGEYRNQFERALGRADESPAAGLLALMELDVSPGICQPAKLAVWFAFWGEVKSRPTYRKICDRIDSYYDEVVERLCAEIIADGAYSHVTAAQAAMALTAMTNGLWLSCLVSPQEWDRHTALDAVKSYLANVFPRHFRSSDIS
jgi:TetR/AcrR family transcriptional regulator, transcriptional repressor of bet genes